ncbi:MAG: pyocin knob domain-containing protein [Cellulosilyticaceae bacterium]
MTILKGELQTDNGDLLYPHTSSNVVFGPDGTPVSKQIDVLQEKSFQDRGISTDGNTANLVGQYRFSSGAKNLPNGTGVLFVLPFDNVSIKQIALIFDGNRTFERQCLVGTWTDWEDKIGTLSNERGYLNTKLFPDGFDFNLLPNVNGRYKIFNALNAPTNESCGWVIDTIAINADFLIQKVNSYGGGVKKHFIRDKVEGAFGQWQEIAITSKINLLATDFKNGWDKEPAVKIPTLEKIGSKVFITGDISNGTKTANTVLLNIPVGYRPTLSCAFGVFTTDGGTNEVIQCAIGPNGDFYTMNNCKTYIKLNTFWEV